ncbi:pyridoxal phosphate-dependent transferase [Podospora didyma]|uniref:Pyridoxal phosphate-dependent transferase n=1 Tax=Podospora didyma TaxID=330526 RepID=A0AAE0NX83_9PEZI|nr:pyridoxal phosphate-dependent transferase [Podospora didyma]
MTKMQESVANRAWGTKLVPGDTNSSRNLHDGVSWGDATATGTAFDFRTDAITTPSINQLAAISRATLNDDVFGEDKTTTLFERHIADICGKEAAAFVISGTMANQLALRALLHQPPHGIIADVSSHVVNFEAGGLAHFGGAMVQAVQPSNGLYLTLDDIRKHAKVSDALEICPTRVISLENTAHGNVIPLQQLQRIRDWTSSHGTAVHIDGARIWDAVASSGATLKQIAACTDAMTLSFAKGLGAPIGAMIVGSKDLIHRAKRLRQSIGGGVRKAGVLTVAAREALLESFGPGDVDVKGVARAIHDMAAAVAGMWTSRGGYLLRPVETNMVWLDLPSAGISAASVDDLAMRRGLLTAAPRIVLHHQISAKALMSLEHVFDDLLAHKEMRIDEMTEVKIMRKGCVQAL